MKNKISKLVVALMAIFLLVLTNVASAYSVDYTYALNGNEGTYQIPYNRLIIAHDTGTYAPARNNAIFEKRTWLSNQAFVQYIVGDGGHVYKVGRDGNVSWGAGSWANANAPVQVELARTYSQAQFNIDYAVYVNLLRDSARTYGISTNLDTGYGIVGHKWVSDNVWGDHQDPYGYLASHGISKAQFAQDLKTGLPENGNYHPNNSSSIQQFKNAGNWYTINKPIRVDEVRYWRGCWQFVNYELAGGRDVNWDNNGIPLAIVTRTDGGDNDNVGKGAMVKFDSPWNTGTIDSYDPATNGVGVNYGKYGMIWFNADTLLKL
ncbi:peptidoglycan recognition protein family protein [Companilactobacillus sp. DQM5]|uniref:peptidoglycan recognition protein family protein n=1 Tax=Companilactobacillus sp. DQM5 TaxID=3463359 RepID=UPI00405A14B0